MNRAELVKSVIEKTDLNRKEATSAVDAVFDSIQEALAEGDRVKIMGFGSFEVRDRKPRTGRNPRKPEDTVEIASTKTPFFKAGKVLKESVR